MNLSIARRQASLFKVSPKAFDVVLKQGAGSAIVLCIEMMQFIQDSIDCCMPPKLLLHPDLAPLRHGLLHHHHATMAFDLLESLAAHQAATMVPTLLFAVGLGQVHDALDHFRVRHSAAGIALMGGCAGEKSHIFAQQRVFSLVLLLENHFRFDITQGDFVVLCSLGKLINVLLRCCPRSGIDTPPTLASTPAFRHSKLAVSWQLMHLLCCFLVELLWLLAPASLKHEEPELAPSLGDPASTSR